jgi:hypothetical protein
MSSLVHLDPVHLHLADLLVAETRTLLSSIATLIPAFHRIHQIQPCYPWVKAAAMDVAAGDFNGDGKPDLVVAYTCDVFFFCRNNITVLLGNGSGGGNPLPSFGLGENVNMLVVGDFNGDGKLDLVAPFGTGSTSPGIAVALGNGDGPSVRRQSFRPGRAQGVWWLVISTAMESWTS